ncbi:hypothetical protein PRZ48_000958 [Zasmidium cellare]|uniref:C3H1-type domain-containing protein n=1 Tax=Zasmidium cellare TaxID=395010 RepID=A0ABR0F1K4_ZASCE|nr:hypothetical protein PRZ48_000958 [Zasmidium cellare]
MSGFQFPPPPPPPPKTSNNDQNQAGQFGESGRGRGRGRGRGWQDSRGRGGRGRGNFSQGRGQHQGNSFQSSPPTSTTSSYSQSQHNFNNSPVFDQSTQYGLRGTAGLPPGSYVNPAFHRNAVESNSNQSTTQSNGSSASPQRNAAGHKRKLEALRGPQQDKKAGPPTAPLIPSFGNPILSANNGAHIAQPPAPQNKRGSNMLGLTPQDDNPQYSSDSDDDAIDEEAMYAELGSNLTFEHNGMVMTLNTAADLAAWKNERLKNFPTKQRLAAKAEEKRQIGEERKRLLTEASQALRAAKDAKHAKARVKELNHHEQQVTSQPEGELDEARRELAIQTARLDQLRKKVAKNEDGAARVVDQDASSQGATTAIVDGSPPQVDESTRDRSELHAMDVEDIEDLTTAMTSNELGAHGEDIISIAGDVVDGSVTASQASPPASSLSEKDGSDDDGPPEETTSSRKGPFQQKRRVCKYFAASGSCRDGDMCGFKHELDPRAASSLAREQQRRENYAGRHNDDGEEEDPPSSKRKNIFDRLLEQEQGQEDKLALQVIRYLGQMGLFAKHEDGAS